MIAWKILSSPLSETSVNKQERIQSHHLERSQLLEELLDAFSESRRLIRCCKSVSLAALAILLSSAEKQEVYRQGGSPTFAPSILRFFGWMDLISPGAIDR